MKGYKKLKWPVMYSNTHSKNPILNRLNYQNNMKHPPFTSSRLHDE